MEARTYSRSSTGKKSRSKDSKNPYADRGLDKFSALLADLEDKRQRIYTQKGAEEISFVRFVYSNANDCKPIVVKAKVQKKQEKTDGEDVKEKHMTTHLLEDGSADELTIVKSSDESPRNPSRTGPGLGRQSYKRVPGFLTWDFVKLENWWRPSYCFPVIVILILLFLAIFGRSFAILCTSIGWYSVPTVKGCNPSSKKPKRKKELARGVSDNRIAGDGSSSPTSVITGPVENNSPRKHGHKKSW